MKIFVNNKENEIAAGSSIADLAAQLGLPAQGVAIAVNNKMIPRASWAEHLLQSDDKLVVINAACGG